MNKQNARFVNDELRFVNDELKSKLLSALAEFRKKRLERMEATITEDNRLELNDFSDLLIAAHNKIDKFEGTITSIDELGCALGIPMPLVQLMDFFYEWLPKKLSVTWPERFICSIKANADLSEVWHKFVIWMLTDPTNGVLQLAHSYDSQEAITKVAYLYEKQLNGVLITPQEFNEAALKAGQAKARWAAGAVHAAWSLTAGLNVWTDIEPDEWATNTTKRQANNAVFEAGISEAASAAEAAAAAACDWAADDAESEAPVHAVRAYTSAWAAKYAKDEWERESEQPYTLLMAKVNKLLCDECDCSHSKNFDFEARAIMSGIEFKLDQIRNEQVYNSYYKAHEASEMAITRMEDKLILLLAE